MSFAPSIAGSVANSVVRSVAGSQVARDGLFQDLPILDKNTRLTVIEMKQSDKQIVNELIYRWCRILTRATSGSLKQSQLNNNSNINDDAKRVLIIDLIGAVSLFRLATVLKKEDRRLRLINIVRDNKINDTYITLKTHLLNSYQPSIHSVKLIVIYQDAFYVKKTIELIEEFHKTVKCQVVLVIPRLEDSTPELLNFMSHHQMIRCEFCVARKLIGPAQPESVNDSYHTYLNQVIFYRLTKSKTLPDRVTGELREDGLNLDLEKHIQPQSISETVQSSITSPIHSLKRIKL